MRSNQFVAKVMGISRRKADELIGRGGFAVNGEPLDHPGRQVDPRRDKITYCNRELKPVENCYLVLYKPEGYVCSHLAQGEEYTVYQLLPPEYRDLKYAGRLDKESAGLMIFSNDGDFIQQLTHPAHQHIKEYLVKVWYPRGAVKNQVLGKLNRPMKLEDGFTAHAEVEFAGSRPGLWELVFRLREGHKRQIRQMCREAGLKIIKLLRYRMGGLYLPQDMPPGTYRLVSQQEARTALQLG